MKFNIKYFVAFLVLLLIEVCIALFVHDQFVRPFVGDILVVIVIYTFVKSFVVKEVKGLILIIFMFSVLVEVAQLFEIPSYLGLDNNALLSVLCGSVFDYRDIICYGAGCIILYLYEKATRFA